MDEQYAEYARLVIFKDSCDDPEPNIDFGIYIPEINKVMCLCCGGTLEMDEITILHDFGNLEYVHNTIARNFLESLPADSPHYQEIMKKVYY